MLSLKRLLYIVLMVAVLGGVFLIYNRKISRPAGASGQEGPVPEWEFMGTIEVDEGDKPRVWILGSSGEGRCGEIYDNVRRFCQDLHLTVAGEGRLDVKEAGEQDLVILCDASVSPYADPAQLEGFVAGGGRVILAAGLAEGDGDSQLWPVFGIREISPGQDCHDLVFEKPLLPVQPGQARYDGCSGSARLEVEDDAAVYLREGEEGIPILYTYAWQEGGICLINGSFLADIRCMGLLTGSISALLPDFVYPVLGVKAVYLDRFPMVTPADDELCRRVYGYSGEGFVRDVVWPVFQGISLRTDTPLTCGIPASSLGEDSGETEGGLAATVGSWVLQFGGELLCTGDSPGEGNALRDVPGADLWPVREMPGSPDRELTWEEGRPLFPGATWGNDLEEGNLFAIYSVLGAYGMVSHVFDGSMLIAGEGDDPAWDRDKRQIGLFESQVLDRVPWLEGRTLTRTEGALRS